MDLKHLENTEDIYARMLQVWQAKNLIVLAGKLDRTPQAVRDQKSQQRVPAEFIWHTVAETGCRLAWLVNGELPQYDEHLRVNQLPPSVQRVVDGMLRLTEAQQATLEACLEVLSSGISSLADSLSTVIQSFHLWVGVRRRPWHEPPNHHPRQ